MLWHYFHDSGSVSTFLFSRWLYVVDDRSTCSAWELLSAQNSRDPTERFGTQETFLAGVARLTAKLLSPQTLSSFQPSLHFPEFEFSSHDSLAFVDVLPEIQLRAVEERVYEFGLNTFPRPPAPHVTPDEPDDLLRSFFKYRRPASLERQRWGCQWRGYLCLKCSYPLILDRSSFWMFLLFWWSRPEMLPRNISRFAYTWPEFFAKGNSAKKYRALGYFWFHLYDWKPLARHFSLIVPSRGGFVYLSEQT